LNVIIVLPFGGRRIVVTRKGKAFAFCVLRSAFCPQPPNKTFPPFIFPKFSITYQALLSAQRTMTVSNFGKQPQKTINK